MILGSASLPRADQNRMNVKELRERLDSFRDDDLIVIPSNIDLGMFRICSDFSNGNYNITTNQIEDTSSNQTERAIVLWPE